MIGKKLTSWKETNYWKQGNNYFEIPLEEW